MESNTQNQPQKTTGAATARAIAAGAQTLADKVSDAAHDLREQFEHVEERGAEILDQAKQKISAAYDQANKRAGEQYEKAVDYGRENPGLTTLMAVGVGVGIGLLLARSFSTLRSRVAR